VLILSGKIPIAWCVFKESVKVCTPKSPAFADNASFDLSALNVFAHRSRIQLEDFRRVPEGEEALSNRFR